MINVRTAKEVAANLVYPDKKEDKNETGKPAKAQNIRYIASVEKTRKKEMEEIYEEVKDENFNNRPLVCVMDGSLYLWKLFKDVFKDIENKVLALDIIHVLEYIWIIGHLSKTSKSSLHFSFECNQNRTFIHSICSFIICSFSINGGFTLNKRQSLA